MANHIYGLSGSGLDIDSLVKQAMKAQQARYDSLYQKKTQLEWKKADYNSLYTTLKTFRENTLFNYRMENTLNPKKAASSNTDLVDISASADAAAVTHSLQVNKVAKGAGLTSSDVITTSANKDKTTLATQFGIPTDQFTIRLTNGTESKEITVDPTKSIYELVSTINDAGVHIKASYDTTLDRMFIYTSNTGASTSIDFSGSSAKGLAFINESLKIDTTFTPVPKVTSTASLDLNGVKAKLSSQFSDLTTPFTLKITDATKGVDQIISIDPNTDTLATMMAKINDSTASPSARAAVNYDPTTGKVKIVSKDGSNLQLSSPDSNILNDLQLPADIPGLGASSAVNIGLDPLKDTVANQLGITQNTTIKINNTSIDINATDTVQGLIDKLNGAMGTTATTSYDAATGKISITAASGNLDLSNYDSAALGLLSGTLKLPVLKQTIGEDAQITLDGVTFNESSNNFTIAGLTYTLKGESPTTTINVSVTNDEDKLVANVKSFIDAYNTMLDKINNEVDEAVYRDYLPLTSDQKANMKDSEITLWEQNAKSGMLHNDSILQDLSYGMRNELASKISGIDGKYNSAASIGITTGDYSEKGKLYLDETKLRKALQEDPDAVYNIFGTTSDDANQQGIAVKMYDLVKKDLDKIVDAAGTSASTDFDTQSSLAKQISDYDDRMYDMSEKLKDLEDSYYKKFDAMEEALANMNKQSSWLSQQFSN